MKPETPDRLVRWILSSTQPEQLSLDHAALIDIAWAADQIADLREHMAMLKEARQALELIKSDYEATRDVAGLTDRTHAYYETACVALRELGEEV